MNITSILTKKEFLKQLDEVLQDDDVIAVTQHISSSSVKKRGNNRSVEFAFAADAFEHKEGVGDIMYGKVNPMALMFGKKEFFSKKSLKYYEGAKAKEEKAS